MIKLYNKRDDGWQIYSHRKYNSRTYLTKKESELHNKPERKHILNGANEK